MKLNKGKCELITTHPNADIHFEDKTQIKKSTKATYLGCEIGIKLGSREELNRRFANTMVTMRKLDLFWRHSNCGTAIKLQVADAVLRSKLLYGIESSQLTPAAVRRLETFQLKVIRKILKMNTTFIDRANTNEVVYKTANRKLEQECRGNQPPKKLGTFADAYRKLKIKRACKIIRQQDSSIHKISFQGNRLRKWIHANRRVGRPRLSWTEETIKEIWELVKKSDSTVRFTAFDGANESIIHKIKEFAKDN